MPADASSLRCPHCGANAAPDAHRCRFCRGRLATISCPSCFTLMFDTATFCASCGTRRARAELESTTVKCPGCKAEMERVSVGATTLLECRACDGVWVDAADFERVCAEAEAQAAVLHHLGARGSVVPSKVQYRPCARCGTMMNRVNFGQISGTVVDVCRGHGTFLDAGEFHAVVSFVRGGGLERARQHRQEELKAQEREVERKASLLARRQGLMKPARKPPEPGGWTARGVFDLLDILSDND